MSGLTCIRFAISELLLPLALLIPAGSAMAQYSVETSGGALGTLPQPQPAIEDKYLKVVARHLRNPPPDATTGTRTASAIARVSARS